jgi:hypothetical protein
MSRNFSGVGGRVLCSCTVGAVAALAARPHELPAASTGGDAPPAGDAKVSIVPGDP